MKAMILAAGLGTRLRPLTDRIPKALVPISGQPILGLLMQRLRDAGFNQVVINVHHLASLIEQYLRQHQSLGLACQVSDERAALLDTGGGLRHALPLLEPDGQVLVHNVDILSNCNLSAVMSCATDTAILVVSERQSSRHLLFNDDMQLCGWIHHGTGQTKPDGFVYRPGEYRELAYSGIQVVNTSLVRNMPQGCYSIVDYYLSICRHTPIHAFMQPNLKLLDIGKPETLRQANLSDFIQP